MAVYSFSIIVRELSEEQAFDVFDLDDCVGGGATAGVPYVEFEVETDMPEGAVDGAIRGLRDMGIEPVRVEMDLVNISAIAERTGVTRQGVRHWVEGDRGGQDFPLPFSVSNGQRLWLWSNVYAWLIENDKQVDEDYANVPLDAQTLLCYNGHLADPDGPYRSPAEKRAATGEIPVLFAANLTALLDAVLYRPSQPESAGLRWMAAASRTNAPQRLDHKERRTVTPAGEYVERAL